LDVCFIVILFVFGSCILIGDVKPATGILWVLTKALYIKHFTEADQLKYLFLYFYYWMKRQK